MKKLLSCFLCLMVLVFGVSIACAYQFTLDYKGDTTLNEQAMASGAVATLFSDAMQTFQASGTGNIDPFLTLQNTGTEYAMNTDFHPPPYDAKRGGNPGYSDAYTHSIQYSQLIYGGTTSTFQFLLDSDEPNNTGDGTILLTDFEVWLLPESAGGFLDEYSDLTSLGTQVFDLGADSILFDSTIWKGSGNVMDLALEIPFFSGLSTDYVYVWTGFDLSADGPEEWILGKGESVPEPATMLLFGSGLVGLVGFRRKKLFKK